ncbi:MAG: hypothetical protein CFE46_13275 [Burkholderiales bacterium PBB6]|nr:MAG: hypothetical protein CFE46_13275 [Burkholderiales bacterium PBB6]
MLEFVSSSRRVAGFANHDLNTQRTAEVAQIIERQRSLQGSDLCGQSSLLVDDAGTPRGNPLVKFELMCAGHLLQHQEELRCHAAKPGVQHKGKRLLIGLESAQVRFKIRLSDREA